MNAKGTMKLTGIYIASVIILALTLSYCRKEKCLKCTYEGQTVPLAPCLESVPVIKDGNGNLISVKCEEK
jgi:hypothetical protein